MKVDVVDIGCGNISSISHWLEKESIDVNVVTSVTDLVSRSIFLPGVGSAGYYLNSLVETGFGQAIQDHVAAGGRLVGICLGFQAMSDFCEEDGGHAGLGLVHGNVLKLNSTQTHNQWESFELKVEDLNSQNYKSEFKLSKKRVLRGRVFYNHEYGFIVDDDNVYKKAINESLESYSGIVVKGGVIGMQFHPEKSQVTGSELIKMIL